MQLNVDLFHFTYRCVRHNVAMCFKSLSRKEEMVDTLSLFSHMQKAARDKKLRTFYAKVLYKKEQEIKSVVCNSSHTCGNIYPFRNKNGKGVRAFFER
jgi:hypothetical protein